MTQPRVHVSVFDEQEDMSLNLDIVEEIVNQVVLNEGQFGHEASVTFISDEEMRRMHDEHFDDPSPTDCISFPMDDASEQHHRILGDIFVCPKTAMTYAKENNHDPYREVTLYIVHGLLHLLGYDDIKEDHRLAMRAAEAKHMAALEKSGLLMRSA